MLVNTPSCYIIARRYLASVKLSPHGLGFFHELRDNTIYTTGFVFVGLSYFQTHLLQAMKRGVAEFYRRVGARWTETSMMTRYWNSPKFITDGNMYSKLFDHFCQEQKSAAELLIIGYSYGDNHINEIINSGKFKKITNVNPGCTYQYSNAQI